MHRLPPTRRCAAGAALTAAVLLLASCASVPTPDELFRATAATHGDRAAVVPGVPDHPRRGGPEHGVAALLNAAAFWQKDLDYTNAAALMARARGAGLPAEDALIASGISLGLWSFSKFGTPDEVTEKLRRGVPVIVMLQDWTDIASRRFSVVVGYDDVTRQFLCHDGEAAARIVDYEEFLRKWLPARFWMAVLCKPEAASWALRAEDYLARGRFHEARGSIADARADYEKALSLQPASAEMKRALAVAVQKGADYARAEKLFRELHEADPADARNANNLAYVLARQRKSLDEAERLSRPVVQADPNNPVVLDTLGYILVLRKNFTEAIPLLEAAYGKAPSLDPAAQHEIAVHLALAYLGDRREQMMRKIVGEILAIDPHFKLPAELKEDAP